ncbi:hypothetical protein [Mucilaginibacter lappiensis]|uniref:hypothetical protein n=1 Tax=Mucilaginibacter lappiensis TaxID=354630 RepID=UPI003D1D35A5
MHRLHSVYNTIDDRPISTLTLIIVCLAFALLIYATFAIYRGIGKNLVVTMRGGGKTNIFIPIILAETVYILFFLFSNISTINLYQHDKDIYNSKQLLFVEGAVTDFHPMPGNGHGNEYFYVNGVPFGYSKFEEGIGGYHMTSLDGGAVKANLYVRIGYYHTDFRNIILKLETE